MILVFGTICIDRVRAIPRLPDPGGYVEIAEEQVFLGGEAANTGLALKTWGCEIVLAGNQLGSGENAHKLLELLVEKALPTDRLTLGETATPVCEVFVTPDGERTMYGAGFRDIGTPIDPLALPYRAGCWFTTDPNLGEAAREASRIADHQGMRLYLMDFLKPDDPITPECYWQSSTDWAGTRGNTQKNVAFVKKFIEEHGCFCVLSDGPNGLVAGSPELPAHSYPPFPCPKLVDSTGAGDMFRAGMIFGLDQGWEIGRCLQYASAAGCLKCQSLGATSRVPSIEEIEGHVAANPEVARHYL